MRKRHKFILCFLIGFILVLSGAWIFSDQILSYIDSEKKDYVEVSAPELDISLHGNQQEYVLVQGKSDNSSNSNNNVLSSNDIKSSSNYVLTSSYRYDMNDYSDRNHYEDGEFYNIYTYDLKNNFKKTTIDVVQLFKNHKLSGNLGAKVFPVIYQGTDYIFMVLSQWKSENGQSEMIAEKPYLVTMDGKQVMDAPDELYKNYENHYNNDAFSDIYGYSNISLVLSNQFNLFVRLLFQLII